MDDERDIEQLAHEFTEHFLSEPCPVCHAPIGEPCYGMLGSGKYHIVRGLAPEDREAAR